MTWRQLGRFRGDPNFAALHRARGALRVERLREMVEVFVEMRRLDGSTPRDGRGGSERADTLAMKNRDLRDWGKENLALRKILLPPETKHEVLQQRHRHPA